MIGMQEFMTFLAGVVVFCGIGAVLYLVLWFRRTRRVTG